MKEPSMRKSLDWYIQNQQLSIISLSWQCICSKESNASAEHTTSLLKKENDSFHTRPDHGPFLSNL